MTSRKFRSMGMFGFVACLWNRTLAKKQQDFGLRHDESSYNEWNNNETKIMTPKIVQNDDESSLAGPESAMSRRFLTTELKKLILKWEQDKISPAEAKEAVWNIVKSREFIDHRPNRGIVFVKTFKTGSSTVTSMLHALATSHKLTTPVSLPIFYDLRTEDGRNSLVNLPTTTAGIQNPPYDVWCNHVRFDDFLLDEVVPTAKGKYVSIVRDPATRLRSVCNNFACCHAKTEKEWIELILSEDPSNPNTQLRGNCNMDNSFKLLVPGEPNSRAKHKMENLVHREDLLLLVTERMAESMVVLKNFYNLHPLDVTYLSKKVREKEAGVQVNKKSQELLQVEQLVRQWNPYDYDMHNLANSKLTRKLEELYPIEKSRKRVIKEFKILNDIINHVCEKELHRVASDLNVWCREKGLDNLPWNEYHIQRMQSSTALPTI